MLYTYITFHFPQQTTPFLLMNKRRTFLLGAGAVIDWNGPKTCELTKLIRESGFYCSDNKTRITEFIFQSLVTNGYDEEEVNFETIINALEELLVFYSSFDKDKKTPSLLKVFFHSSFEDILLNFSVEGGAVKHGFKLEIPKGKTYKEQHIGALNKETPAQYFFQLLLAELLTLINVRISNYAYHRSDKHTRIFTEKNTEINSLFSNWIRRLNTNENVLRLYTLNYDRNFKVIALRSGIDEMFEGFECDESIELETQIHANIPRIMTDFDCHCYYNLHGSAFWNLEPRDEFQLFNAELFLQGAPQLQANITEQPYLQIEKGKNILISNIIVGYQKVQKGFISPFKQMQSAFEIDCIQTDILYLIGYSFGDEHINMSIKMALKHNPSIKIYIVDPAYDERDGKNGYELLQQKFLNVFTHYINDFTSNKISETCNEYFNKKITVYAMGMKEFLKEQNN